MDADVSEDAYAAGATVAISGTVGQDLTAAGFTIRLEPGGMVERNARLAAATISVEAPISGALSASGRDVFLNAPISGDVRIVSKTLRFGPEARIDGRLTYSAKEEIQVPERVVAPDRVRFERMTAGRVWDELEEMPALPFLPTFAAMVFSFLITLVFFVVLGALALGFFPVQLEAMRRSISDAFGKSILLGVIGLSLLFGAVLVTAMTVVGLPFVPIIILSIVVTWTLAYALGAYAAAIHLWYGLSGDPEPGFAARLLLLAAAVTAVALLNFIPFVGWIANFTLVLLGFGAMTRVVFEKAIGVSDPALHAE
jgi:hypothetical protein